MRTRRQISSGAASLKHQTASGNAAAVPLRAGCLQAAGAQTAI